MSTMLMRLSSDQLRKLADQLDAYTRLSEAGADHLPPNTVLKVDGSALAYAHWWQDKEQWLAEFTSWTPGTAEPLCYHEVASR